MCAKESTSHYPKVFELITKRLEEDPVLNGMPPKVKAFTRKLNEYNVPHGSTCPSQTQHSISALMSVFIDLGNPDTLTLAKLDTRQTESRHDVRASGARARR